MFLGTGEHIRDLEAFDANKFISRLLGMGDLSSLIQIAAEEIDDQKGMEAVSRAIMTGKFNLNDMYYQMAAVGKMGTLEKLMRTRRRRTRPSSRPSASRGSRPGPGCPRTTCASCSGSTTPPRRP